MTQRMVLRANFYAQTATVLNRVSIGQIPKTILSMIILCGWIQCPDLPVHCRIRCLIYGFDMNFVPGMNTLCVCDIKSHVD